MLQATACSIFKGIFRGKKMLSYILSLLGLGCNIAASLIKGKRMRMILILVCVGNALVATSYVIDGSLNGAISCYLGAVVTLINAVFEKKEKDVPIWLMGIYAAAFIFCNVIAGFSWVSLPAIIATLAFVACIGQKNGAGYRFFVCINSVCWCLYDVLSASYAGLITHLSLFLFTVVGMIIHDRKKA